MRMKRKHGMITIWPMLQREGAGGFFLPLSGSFSGFSRGWSSLRHFVGELFLSVLIGCLDESTVVGRRLREVGTLSTSEEEAGVPELGT
jgi:hypothetical protein